MNFKSLEVLIMVFDELHFGTAARKLMMSQSSVSEYIKRLEDDLGGELFKRSSRKVEPTTTCINLVNNIRDPVLKIRSNIINTKKEYLGLRGIIKLGFLGGGFYDYHGDIDSHLKRFYPEVKTQYIETDYQSHFSSIINKEVDIGVCRSPIENEELDQSETLFSDTRSVCLPINHPLSINKKIHIDDLKNEKILTPDSLNVDKSWYKFHFPLTTSSGECISQGEIITTVREGVLSVASGKGVFFIATKATPYYSSPDVCFIETTLPMMDTRLAWRKNDKRALTHKIINEIELFFKYHKK